MEQYILNPLYFGIKSTIPLEVTIHMPSYILNLLKKFNCLRLSNVGEMISTQNYK